MWRRARVQEEYRGKRQGGTEADPPSGPLRRDIRRGRSGCHDRPGGPRPSFGGLAFHEVSAILRGVARKGVVVGYDIVEVVPARDPIGLTAACVARLTLLLMGEVWRARRGV